MLFIDREEGWKEFLRGCPSLESLLELVEKAKELDRRLLNLV